MAKTIDSSYIFEPYERRKHARVYAGPGAGKTHFLVQNIRNVVETDDLIRKSSRRKVLCITYTNAAVKEISDRLGPVSNRVDISTIHAFVYEHIVRPFQFDLKRIMNADFRIEVACSGVISSQVEGFGVLHGVDKEDIYRFIANEIGESSYLYDYSKKAMGEVGVDLKAFLSSGEKRLQSGSKILPAHVNPIKKYIWGEARKLTHDEILYFGYRILKENSLALYTLRVKFPYVFIDEFQDTNPLQTKIVELMGQRDVRICVVGDEAQSIYSFQGATPSDFRAFEIEGQECLQYCIVGNRRSTGNIINLCNFFRQADRTVVQECLRNEQGVSIHFLLGRGSSVLRTIRAVMGNGGVVLTRTWAEAFNYIEGLTDQQVRYLRDIYNSYFMTSIQIRDEVSADNSNVQWVRAFKFIFALWRGYRSRSVNAIVLALESYSGVNRKALSAGAIRVLTKILESVLGDVDEDSECPTISVISDCLVKLRAAKEGDLHELLEIWSPEESCFDEYDYDDGRRRLAIEHLSWKASYKLFSEVFADNSRYMTVHQAKGLEWRSVVVGVRPARADRTELLSVYQNPQVLGDDSVSEFVRIYYVACSRAVDELYVHIPEGSGAKRLIKDSLDAYKVRSGLSIDYDFVE